MANYKQMFDVYWALIGPSLHLAGRGKQLIRIMSN